MSSAKSTTAAKPPAADGARASVPGGPKPGRAGTGREWSVPILRCDVAADPTGHAPRRSTVTPADFARHRRMIVRSCRRALTVSAYCAALRSGEAPPDAVVITLEGDHAETLAAASDLVDRGLTATVFVTTSRLGTPGMLSDIDVRRMHEMGVEIGGSGHTGRRLDGLSRSDVTAEITLCRRRLAAVTGEEPRSFAYPRGGWDPGARQLVIAAGYSGACAVGEALSHPADDPFALTRLTVDGGLADHRVRAWLDGVGRTIPRTVPARSRLRLPPATPGMTAPWRLASAYRPRLDARLTDVAHHRVLGRPGLPPR